MLQIEIVKFEAQDIITTSGEPVIVPVAPGGEITNNNPIKPEPEK